MNDFHREDIRERLSNIAQIRDIIFGAHIRSYDNRLDKLESDLAVVQQEMRDRFDQLKTSLFSELKKSIEVLENKLKTANVATQDEHTDLRQQVDRLHRKLASRIDSLHESTDCQTALIQNELAQTRHQSQEDNRTLRDWARDELDRRFAQMQDIKISREDMAELLFTLGMKLKGTEFVPVLQDAAERNTNGNNYTIVRFGEDNPSA
ncbi:MAG: hypothetical protein HC769_12170 [Cyanobacteria bacterium CRU_2_1]|nr:hypothetical protein [Cyanobacteria bacterium CRU_2_1]